MKIVLDVLKAVGSLIVSVIYCIVLVFGLAAMGFLIYVTLLVSYLSFSEGDYGVSIMSGICGALLLLITYMMFYWTLFRPMFSILVRRVEQKLKNKRTANIQLFLMKLLAVIFTPMERSYDDLDNWADGSPLSLPLGRYDTAGRIKKGLARLSQTNASLT